MISRNSTEDKGPLISQEVVFVFFSFYVCYWHSTLLCLFVCVFVCCCCCCLAGEGQRSSVQFKVVSMRSEKPICAPPRLSEVSPMLLLKQFRWSSDWRWLSLVLTRPLALPLVPRLSPLSSTCSVTTRSIQNAISILLQTERCLAYY